MGNQRVLSKLNMEGSEIKMDSYYDSLNDFYELNEREHLASSAQLVYLHLLHLNNRSGNGGVVQVSDRQLETMTGLAKQSVTRAKQILKNRGLIDFKAQKGKPTTITLSFFVGHLVGQSVGHLVGHLVGHSVANPFITCAQNRASEAPAPCPAPSPAPSPTPLTPPSPSPSPSPPTTTTSSSSSAGARESESESEATGLIPYTPDELVEVLDYWDEELRGGRLTFEHQSELEVYLREHGLEWVKAAMKEAADSNGSPYGIRPKYLFAILKGRANPKLKTTKGGERDEQRDEYAKPEYSDDEPWNKF